MNNFSTPFTRSRIVCKIFYSVFSFRNNIHLFYLCIWITRGYKKNCLWFSKGSTWPVEYCLVHQSAKGFSKERLLGCEILMVKIGQLSTKLWHLSWWFPSLNTRGPIPLGARGQPSVTNDHHLWSLNKGNILRSPHRTQQIDLIHW